MVFAISVVIAGAKMRNGTVIYLCVWLVVVVVAGFVRGGECPKFDGGRKVGSLQAAVIREASGLSASAKNRGVLWTHNDRGSTARLYAISTEGKLLATCTVWGVLAHDWEDIAIGPGPDPNIEYLYIGDIGDNKAKRDSIAVHRVPEPEIDVNSVGSTLRLKEFETIKLRYPDGSRNAETLLLDPVTKDIYIVSKESKTKVYRAGYPQSTNKVTTMEQVGTIGSGTAVGGDISQDGSMIIIKGYFSASLWERAEGQSVAEALEGKRCRIPLILELQGEAICFDAEGAGYFTVSEHKYQPIYYFARKANEKDK